jgi:hypothetical protein
VFTIVLPAKDEDERRRGGQALEVHQAEKTRQNKTRQDKTRQGTHATWQQQRSRGHDWHAGDDALEFERLLWHPRHPVIYQRPGHTQKTKPQPHTENKMKRNETKRG